MNTSFFRVVPPFLAPFFAVLTGYWRFKVIVVRLAP
jgi:hypothetical protein